MTTPTGQPRIRNWRNLVVYAIITGVLVIFIARLFNLQILNGKSYSVQAESNRTQTISVAAPRGIIYDRNSIVLAQNTASYNIVITPASLPDDDGDIQRIYRELSALTGVPVNHGTLDDAKLLQPCTPGPGITQFVDLGISNAPYNPVAIQCNVDEQTAMIVDGHATDW
jgi:penicillin-binding protein 2